MKLPTDLWTTMQSPCCFIIFQYELTHEYLALCTWCNFSMLVGWMNSLFTLDMNICLLTESPAKDHSPNLTSSLYGLFPLQTTCLTFRARHLTTDIVYLYDCWWGRALLRPQPLEETGCWGNKSSEKYGHFLISLHTIRLLFKTSDVAPCWPLDQLLV